VPCIADLPYFVISPPCEGGPSVFLADLDSGRRVQLSKLSMLTFPAALEPVSADPQQQL
jgi:hypothetical protein